MAVVLRLLVAAIVAAVFLVLGMLFSSSPASADEAQNGNPLASIGSVAAAVAQPVVDTVTPAIDPVVEAVEPVLTPVVDAVEPVLTPVVVSVPVLNRVVTNLSIPAIGDILEVASAPIPDVHATADSSTTAIELAPEVPALAPGSSSKTSPEHSAAVLAPRTAADTAVPTNPVDPLARYGTSTGMLLTNSGGVSAETACALTPVSFTAPLESRNVESCTTPPCPTSPTYTFDSTPD